VKYRKFGKLGWQVSALGLGCMRLPTIGGESARIDEPLATRMLQYAIDHGVNYVDTAYGYHGGNSERLVGKVLQDGYRERVRLATKLPLWLVKSPSDFDRLLNEQLGKLQTDHIDVYLLHSLSGKALENMRANDVPASAEKAIADGRIGCLGFSFHDNLAAFQTILDDYAGWAMCQIQYNYMNEGFQAGTAGLQYAASRGLAVVVMEPLLGGRLVYPPLEVQAIWDAAPVRRTPVEWALSWLWNKPEVSVVLSGMSSMQQVQENVRCAERSRVGMLSPEELDVVARARDAYNRLSPVPCTGCRYCMPCPNGVNIPEVLAILNRGVMYASLERPRREYAGLPEEERASSCLHCRACEAECPQTIPISEWMPVAQRVLGEGQPYDPSTCPPMRAL